MLVGVQGGGGMLVGVQGGGGMLVPVHEGRPPTASGVAMRLPPRTPPLRCAEGCRPC